MDHHQFDEDLLDKGTQAILKTRDGKLRAAIPSPLGSCVFLNDVSYEDMIKALHLHKQMMKEYPRQGEGLEAYVDSSDTGYTLNGAGVEEKTTNGAVASLKKAVLNDDATNGVVSGGPVQNGYTSKRDGVMNGPNGHSNGVNGHSNGVDGHSH